MNEITAVEILEAKPGKEKELKQALLHLVPICRKESGCLQYDLLEPAKGRGHFLVLMRWKSKEALRQHEESAHIAEFVKRAGDVLYGDVTQTEWIDI